LHWRFTLLHALHASLSNRRTLLDLLRGLVCAPLHLATFTTLAAVQKKPAIVYLDNPGGHVLTAIKIGLTIKDRGFSTLVDHPRCASACATIWLGGKQRYMSSTALLGFHASIDKRTSQPSPAGNAMVGAYLSQIGITDLGVITFLVMADPKSMHWVSRGELLNKNISVDQVSLNEPQWVWAREKLYPPAPADPASASVATQPVMSFKALNAPPAPIPAERPKTFKASPPHTYVYGPR
jgi:hypothetical protein